jgi:hypothetical protein
MGLDLKPLVPILPMAVLSAAAVVAAVWGAWVVYSHRKSLGAAFGTAVIRLAAVAVFTVSFLGIRSTGEKAVATDKPVVVFVDCSASMDANNAEGIRLENTAFEIYDEIIDVLEDVGADPRAYLFADGLYALNEAEPQLEKIPAGGRSSSELEAVFGEVTDLEEPAAAVVISDGFWAEVRAPSFPVYVFSPSTEPAPGVFPVSAEAPRFVLPGTRFPLRITFAGASETAVGFAVHEGDETAAEGAVPAGAGSPESTVYLSAETPGVHFFEITTEEGYPSVWTWTEVVSGPISVYFRSGWADPDAAFFRRAVAANKQIECDYRQDLIGSRSIDAGPGFGPAGADVIILANPRSEFIDGGFAADLERCVADGAGLLIYYSAYPPDTRVLSLGSLAALSPVRPSPAGTLEGGGVPAAGPGAALSEFRPSAVPEFDFVLGLGDPKPFAAPLLETPGGSPVLLWMPYGRGKVMLLAGGGLAGWELSRKEEEPGLDAFAADIVLFLYGGDESLTVGGRVAEVGVRNEVYVMSSGEPTIVIGGPDDKTTHLPAAESRPNVWTAEWEAQLPGLYTVTARRFDDGGLSVDKVDVYVTEKLDERAVHEQGRINLIKLAELSGGRFYPDGADERFAQDVSETLEEAAPSETVETSAPLLPLWLGLTVFLGLLSVEWIVRRLSGLA